MRAALHPVFVPGVCKKKTLSMCFWLSCMWSKKSDANEIRSILFRLLERAANHVFTGARSWSINFGMSSICW